MTLDDVHAKFKDIDEKIKKDPRMIVNTLLNYFGGADALWHAVHEHITDFHDMDMFYKDDYVSNIKDLEQAYEKALSQVVEQEFLVNDNN